MARGRPIHCGLKGRIRCRASGHLQVKVGLERDVGGGPSSDLAGNRSSIRCDRSIVNPIGSGPSGGFGV
jgi:hypothetical protein